MPDLSQELEELHASVVRAVRFRIDNGEQSNDDIRTALMLLKQNSISAQMDRTDTEAMKSKMASKLIFTALERKVRPIRDDAQQSVGDTAVTTAN